MSLQRQLRTLIRKCFSLAELRDLAFDLRVNFDDLQGSTLSQKISGLLFAAFRLNKLQTLHQLLVEERPNVDWPTLEEILEGNWSQLADEITLPQSVLNQINTQVNFKNSTIIIKQSSDGDDLKERENEIEYWTDERIPIAPLSSRVGIENFIHLYLGDKRSGITVPFGGRDQILAELNSWSKDHNAPQFGFLVAEAGRGKSALLVRWAKQLVENRNSDVIFFPVSIRFGTTHVNQLYHAIAWHFYYLYGDSAPVSETNDWRADFVNLLKRKTEKNRKNIVLIIDGLDEGNWADSIGSDFLPHILGDNIKILISARLKPGDVDDTGWRSQLGLERPNMSKSFHLEPLRREGIADVLDKMGNPLDKLAANFDLLQQLVKLTEGGDPLLINLFVDALAQEKLFPDDLVVTDLQEMAPGLGGFFKKWWQDQEKWWDEKGDDDPLGGDEVLLFFHLLSLAEAPLKQQDLMELAEVEFGSPRRIKRIARSLNRFVHGNSTEQGYIFSHPRLAYYFRDEISSKEYEEIESRFLRYGKKVLNNFNQNFVSTPIDPRIQMSAYMLGNYGAHLERSYRFNPDKSIVKDLEKLVSEGWLRAKVIYDNGRYDSFLQDIDRVWKLASSERYWNVEMQILCAFCHSSVVTLGNNMIPNVLGALVENKIITQAQALAYVDREPTEKKRTDLVIALVPKLSQDWHEEILAKIAFFKEKKYKAKILTLLIPLLNPTDLLFQKAIKESKDCWFFELHGTSPLIEIVNGIGIEKFKPFVSGYLDSFKNISEEKLLPNSLNLIVKHLSKLQIESMLKFALNIDNFQYRSNILKILAPFLNVEQLKKILDFYEGLECDKVRSSTLIAISSNLHSSLIEDTLSKGLNIEDHKFRSLTLIALAQYLNHNQLDRIVKAISQFRSGYLYANVLNAIIEYLDTGQVHEVLEYLLQIKNFRHRVSVFLNVVPYLQSDEVPITLKHAFHATLNIKDRRYKFAALIEIIPMLDENGLTNTFSVAIQEALNFFKEIYFSDSLNVLFQYLNDQQIYILLKNIYGLADLSQKVSLLVSLARCYPSDIQKLILEVAYNEATQIEETKQCTQALISLLPYKHFVPFADLINISLKKTLNSPQIYHPYQIDALIKLIPHLSPQQIDEVLQIIPNIRDSGARAKLLDRLAPYFSEDQLNTSIRLTLLLYSDSSRSLALDKLVPYLDSLQVEQVQKSILQINDYRDRLNALVIMSPYLEFQSKSRETKRLFEAANGIGDDTSRANVLVNIVSILDSDQLNQAFDVAFAEGRRYPFATLRVLIPHLDSQLINQAFQTALVISNRILDSPSRRKKNLDVNQKDSISLSKSFIYQPSQNDSNAENETVFVYALDVLAPYLEPQQIDKSLKFIAQNFSKGKDLAYGFIPISSYLNSHQIDQVLQIIFDINPNHPMAIRIVESIASYLNDNQIDRTLQHLNNSIFEDTTSTFPYKFLKILSSYLNPEHIDQLLQLVVERHHFYVGLARVIIILAPKLDSQQIDYLISEITGKKSEGNWALNLIKMLCPFLEAHYINKIFHKAMGANDRTCVSVIEILEPYLEDVQINKIYKAALDGKYINYWPKLLMSLAHRLSRHQLDVVLEVVLSTNNESFFGRSDVLSKLAQFLDKRQFLLLFNLVTGKSLENTLNRVIRIQDDNDRADVLSMILPHLEINQIDQIIEKLFLNSDDTIPLASIKVLIPYMSKKKIKAVFNDVNQIRSEEMPIESKLGQSSPQYMELSARGQFSKSNMHLNALNLLIPHLQAQELDQILKSTLQIDNQFIVRAKLLKTIVPHLNARQINQAFEASLLLTDTLFNSRSIALSVLMPYLNKEQLMKGMKSTLELVSDQAPTLKQIIPYLDRRQLDSAIKLALQINQDKTRAVALRLLLDFDSNSFQFEYFTALMRTWSTLDRRSAVREMTQSLSILNNASTRNIDQSSNIVKVLLSVSNWWE